MSGVRITHLRAAPSRRGSRAVNGVLSLRYKRDSSREPERIERNDPDGIATAYLAAAARARTRFWLSEAFSSTRL